MIPRKKTKNKPLPRNRDHPSIKFIFDEISAGLVTPDMGSRAVHNYYKDTLRSFKFTGMEYSSTFPSHLAGIWKIVARYGSQDSNENKSLAIDIHKHSPPTHKIRGEPQWNVYEAQDCWMMTLRLEMI